MPVEQKNRFNSVAVVGVGKTGRFFAENFAGVVKRVDAVRRNSIPKLPSGINLTGDLKQTLEQKPDVVVLAIPNPVKDVVKEIAEYGAPGLTIVLTQNGADAVAVAQKALTDRPDISVVNAKLYTTVGTDEENDLVYNDKKKRVVLASVRSADIRYIETKQEALEQTEALFEQAGFKVKTSENPQAIDMTKLNVNLLGFTAPATGLSTEETFKDKELFKVELQALKGRQRILERAGLYENVFGTWKLKWLAKVPTPLLVPFRNVLAGVISAERNHQPPVAAQQIEKGEMPLEAKYYTEPFIKLGEEVGVQTPVERTVQRLINRHIEKKLNLNNIPDRKGLFLEILKIESQEPFTYGKKIPGFLMEKFAGLFIKDLAVSGTENLDAAIEFGKNGNVIFVPNHNSHADHPVMLAAIKERMGESFDPSKLFIIAGMLFKNELLSSLFKDAWDHLTVWTVKDKQNKEEAWRADIVNIKALKTFIKKLKEPVSVIVYPEGTRGEDDVLQKAVPDASIYFKSGTMIVPVAIRNTRDILPPSAQEGEKPILIKALSKLPKVGKYFEKLQWPQAASISVEFGVPIMADDLNKEAQQYPAEERDEFKTGRIMREVAKMLPEEQRGVYAQAA